jgi:outer membrane receptor protein involved in Fe transport
VIPGAKVEALDVKTQISATATSDGAGHFVFLSLAPSDYTLSVEAAGFRKSVRNQLTLGVAETVNEIIAMEVGAVTESVAVEANAIRVQVSDSQISRAVMLKDIQVLPQLGRGPINIAVFSPGVQIDPSDVTFSRVNGTRQGSSNALLDGIEANDPVAPRFGLVEVGTTTDNVEELRVITNGGKAEYGRNAGGQVQMMTRSGSNGFHGGGWDYLRNTQLNANNFFNNQSGQDRPKYIRNIFGGNFSGPIRKNRTFFFGSYEGNRTRQQVVRNRTVLTPEAKAGLFRWRLNNGPIQAFDIVKNDPRGKGIDPAVKNLLSLTPDPNNFDVGDLLNTAGYRFNAPANSTNDQLTVRVDHELWNGHRIFYRHSWLRTSSIDTTNSAEARYPGQPDGTQGGHRSGYAFGSDWTVSPTVVNEFRFGGQLYNSDFLRPRLHGPMIVPNLYTSPIANPTDFAQGRKLPYKEITDNLTKVHGKHMFKAGVNIRLTDQYSWREDYAWPAVNLSRSFNNTPPAAIGPPSTAISSTDRTRFENLYNDLLGRVSDVQQRFYSDLTTYQPAGTGRVRNFIYRESGYFFQDDWKLNRRFTLNLGLRYEFFGVPTERDGLQGYLDKRDQMNQLTRITDFVVTKGTPYYNNDWNNFAPRIGFAWDVKGDGKTAIRGGWGMFYDRMINSTITSPDGIPGFSTDIRPQPNQNPGSDVRVSDGLPPLPQPTSVVLSIPLDRTTSVTQFMNNLRTGYVLHTSLTVQREIFRNAVIEAGYVGTHGIKLYMHNNLNQSRIYEDFLTAFNQVKAFRDSKAPVPASNTLVRLFGSPDAALTALGATNFDIGAVGSVANTLDNTASNYNRYAAAGLPQTYLRNYPQFSTAYLGTNDGRSYYNSAQVSFRRNAGAFRFAANYTFSKSIDNWANEGNGTDSTSVIDWFNTRLNRARSDFDHTHSFNSSFIYALPVGQNRKFLGSSPGWVDSLLGGWDIGVLNIWQSGSLFTVSSGRATGPGTGNTWADITGSRDFGDLQKRGDGVYMFTAADIARFTFPAAGTIGTTGRNAFRGPRFFNVDTSLSKRFRFTERMASTLRIEAYNLFNEATFGTPSATMATPTSLGKFSGTIGAARVLQAALRFDF